MAFNLNAKAAHNSEAFDVSTISHVTSKNGKASWAKRNMNNLNYCYGDIDAWYKRT